MALQLDQLSFTRGDRPLFVGLSLQLAAGEALWLRGPNGSGKTSLLRLIAGLSQPDSGAVRWAGQGSDDPRWLRYCGHANGLNERLSAIENLQFLARLDGQQLSRAAALTLLARLGLGLFANLPVQQLSQGQRKRVALARLFLDDAPPLWLLDEPFSALDQPAIAQLTERLDAHLAAGGMLVYSTHQPVALRAGVQRELDLAAPC